MSNSPHSGQRKRSQPPRFLVGISRSWITPAMSTSLRRRRRCWGSDPHDFLRFLFLARVFRSSARVALLFGLLEPVRLCFALDDLAAVNEPVDESDDHAGVREELILLLEALVGRQEDGFLLVAPGDQLEEKIGEIGRGREIPQRRLCGDRPEEPVAAGSRLGPWRLSRSPALSIAQPKAYFDRYDQLQLAPRKST